MQIETFRYLKNKGWSINTFPALDSDNTLILVFCSPLFFDDTTAIETLIQHYPASTLMGCSTAGEILDSTISDDSISVAVIKFEKTKIKVASENIKNVSDSRKAGELIATKLNEKMEALAGIFVLSKGLDVNGSELVKGLNVIKNKKVTITGGLAGDGSHFKKTWIVVNGEVTTDRVAAVGFYGKHIQIGYGSKGGWDIFGTERRITRAKDNILYELDGRPALELYKEYLGEKAAELPSSGLLYPLAIRANAEDKKQLVRTILGIDEKEGALIFAGDVPMGYLAQLMRANFDRLVTGAKKAGELLLQSLVTDSEKMNDDPILLLAISCVGRRLLLGERTEEETESILKIFPPNSKMLGFYSYGELSPYSNNECDLHNQTMTLTSLREVE